MKRSISVSGIKFLQINANRIANILTAHSVLSIGALLQLAGPHGSLPHMWVIAELYIVIYSHT